MNAPQNTQATSNRRDATKFAAYVAVDSSSFIDREHESEEWRVLRVEKGLGNSQRAIFARDLGKIGKRIEDRELLPYGSRECEIWTLDENGERLRPIFKGVILTSRPRFAADGEREICEAILPPAWFGNQCEGQQVWNQGEEDLDVVHIDLEFNPLVDGKLTSNCAYRVDVDQGAGVDYDLWIDPESVRTDAAARANDLAVGEFSVQEWTLSRALQTLQRYLNPIAFNVKNFEAEPTDEDTGVPRQDPLFDDSPALQDEILPRGHYLPDYLDALLPKYGYQWTIDFSEHESAEDHVQPQIRVYKRGDGQQKVLPHQAIAQTLQDAKTQPLEVELLTDLSRLANVVVAHGSLQEREITINLYRSWHNDQDATSLSSLDKTEDSYTLDRDGIWRKWVANEAGDYTGVRDNDLPLLANLSIAFFPDGCVPKRRPASDCLTWRGNSAGDASRLPPILEYSIDDGVTWTRYEDHDWRVLTHELGVYLTDPQAGGLMEILHDAGDDARLRLTCTIRGDKRPRVEVDRTEGSPSAIESRLFLDLSHRFHDRERVTTGTYASVLTGDYDEADDEEAMEEFVEKLADIEQSAVIETSFPLHGILFDYEIGDVLTKIEGREISLNRNAQDAAEPKYVQISGIAWDLQQQQTILTVQPYDSFVAPPRPA